MSFKTFLRQIFGEKTSRIRSVLLSNHDWRQCICLWAELRSSLKQKPHVESLEKGVSRPCMTLELVLKMDYLL